MSRDGNAEAANSGALVDMTARIVGAYVKGNRLATADVPAMVATVQTTLAQLANGTGGEPTHAPAVPIKKSIGDDFIICLEDGKRLRPLKRYLKTHFNMSPGEYRRKWGLPADYPMAAPAYARLRSSFAKKIGLGHIPTKPRRQTR